MRSGIQSNVEAQLARLKGFRELLEYMFRSAPVKTSSTARLTLLFASVLRVTQSANAVEMLSNAGCVEEVLSLGRTLVEVTVNAAYLQVTEANELDRFLRYHPESQWKHLGLLGQTRPRGFAGRLKRRVGNILLGGKDSGAEATWSTRSILHRAQLADERSAIPVMVPLVSRCYFRGQAAMQGSVGSLETFITSVQRMERPRVDARMASLTEALFGVNLCLLTLCLYLNALFHLNLDDAIDRAAQADTLDQGATLDQPRYPAPERRFAPGREQ